ncbi:MAG: hypothetical protein K0V04_22275 [Deltaproteobacteria bacterium]|nr:hypothetical protein [Deltaproteobacteria bacterium]
MGTESVDGVQQRGREGQTRRQPKGLGEPLDDCGTAGAKRYVRPSAGARLAETLVS